MIGCLPTPALAFLVVFVYATHATQAIAFEWKPGFTRVKRNTDGTMPARSKLIKCLLLGHIKSLSVMFDRAAFLVRRGIIDFAIASVSVVVSTRGILPLGSIVHVCCPRGHHSVNFSVSGSVSQSFMLTS